jgi:hypothetical protein
MNNLIPKFSHCQFVEIRLVYCFPYSLACQFCRCKKEACKVTRGYRHIPVLTTKRLLLHAGVSFKCGAKHDFPLYLTWFKRQFLKCSTNKLLNIFLSSSKALIAYQVTRTSAWLPMFSYSIRFLHCSVQNMCVLSSPYFLQYIIASSSDNMTVPWLRQLVASLSPRRPTLSPRPVQVGLVEKNWYLKRFSSKK